MWHEQWALTVINRLRFFCINSAITEDLKYVYVYVDVVDSGSILSQRTVNHFQLPVIWTASRQNTRDGTSSSKVFKFITCTPKADQVLWSSVCVCVCDCVCVRLSAWWAIHALMDVDQTWYRHGKAMILVNNYICCWSDSGCESIARTMLSKYI